MRTVSLFQYLAPPYNGVRKCALVLDCKRRRLRDIILETVNKKYELYSIEVNNSIFASNS